MIRADASPKLDSISEYKSILRDCINKRPSGLRGKIARVLGTHKSFVSQITNPHDPTAIPARHVEPIVAACNLSAEEKVAFLEAYNQAHASASVQDFPDSQEAFRNITVRVPVLKDPKKQEIVELLIQDTVRRLFNLVTEDES